jgi:peptide/nickel transport system permease protein
VRERFAGLHVRARAAQSLVTLLVVVILVFFLARLVPGDPVTQILGSEATPQNKAALRAQLHLDQSLPVQFFHYVVSLGHGDLGQSITQSSSVTSILGKALPDTLAIVVFAMIIGCVLGVAFGMLAASTRFRPVDVAVRIVAILLYATPTFVIGLVLILVVALRLKWLPAGGWADSWPMNARFVVLPGLALSGLLVASITRTVRQAALDVNRQLYIEAAFSRGLPPRTLNMRHVFPNCISPVVTLLGVSLGHLITGAIIVEAVFGVPGIGTAMLNAVSQRDYPVIQGIALASALFVLLGNFLGEIVSSLLQPQASEA